MSSVSIPVRKPKTVIKKAPRYGVVFYNNDKTTMDQVLYLLITVFSYTEKLGLDKMMEIHEKGNSIVYIGTKEMCDMKNERTKDLRSVIGEKNLVHKVEVI